MISIKFITLIILGFIIAYLASLSFLSRQTTIKAESERQLLPCPDKNNCVYSDSSTKRFKIEPFGLISGDKNESWRKLIEAIQQAGGDIVVNDGHYCHAVFTSTFFRFKDDLEVAMNENAIAVRSASRAGNSDLGANRKRVEKIRSLYTKTGA